MVKIYQEKAGKKIFADGKSRNTAGQYGKDHSSEFFGGDAVFYQSDIPLKIGDYDFGSVAMHVGKSGISFSATAKTGNVAYALVNQPLPIYLKERGLDKDTVDSITDHIRSRGIDVSSVMVKDIAIEGPAASVGFGIGNQASVGGKLSAQISALRFGLTTSLGEIDLKIKFGGGVEKSRRSITAKKDGKPGIYEETTHSAGIIEMIIREKQSAPESSEHTEKLPETLVTKSVKKAENFIKARKSAPEAPAFYSQKIIQEDITALLDEDARSVAEVFEKDGVVQNLYQEYLKSEDSKKYATFYSKIEAHLTSEKKFDDLMQTASATSMFFSQVAVLTHNRDLAIGAKFLSISTQTFSGFKEIGNSVNLIQAGGLSVTSFGSLMSGAGAVLGAFNALSSLFGDEEDGLGEALAQISQQLAQIHQTIYEMWGDVRERFESTWKMLETMEEHDQKRFELTLNAIRYVHDELKAQAGYQYEVLKGIIKDFGHRIEKYYKYLVNADVKDTIEKIRISISRIPQKSDEDYKLFLENDFRDWCVILHRWLTHGAMIENGAISTRNRRLDITDDSLIDELGKAMSIEHQETSDIRLGLFASLATEIDDEISLTQSAKIINPRDWQYVLEFYEGLWKICVKKGWLLDEAATNVYIEQMNRIAETARYNYEFIQSVANSKKLWKKLVDQYQDNFDSLSKEIKSLQPKPADGYSMPKEIVWDLTQTAEENLLQFSMLSNAENIACELMKDVSWVGVIGTRRENLEFERGGSYQQVPEGDLSLVLSDAQYNAIKNNGIILQCNDISIALAFSYAQISPSLAYYARNIGAWGNYYWDFSVYFILAIKINDKELPFSQANLFRIPSHSQREHELRFGNAKMGFGNAELYKFALLDTGGLTDGHKSYFFRRPEFDKNKALLVENLEKNVLVPSRQMLAKKYFSTEANIIIYLNKIKNSYYKLIAFTN